MWLHWTGALSGEGTRAWAAAFAALALVVAGCAAAPPPQVGRTSVTRAPGESIILAQVQISPAISGVSGRGTGRGARDDPGGGLAGRAAHSPRGRGLPAGQVAPRPLPVGELGSRVTRVSRFGPLDVPFEVPHPDKLYYLGTLVLVGQTTERYWLQTDDHLDEAMRYLVAEQPQLAGPYERRLLTIPSR